MCVQITVRFAIPRHNTLFCRCLFDGLNRDLPRPQARSKFLVARFRANEQWFQLLDKKPALRGIHGNFTVQG